MIRLPIDLPLAALLVLSMFAPSAAAQNLLRADGWRIDGNAPLASLELRPASIVFRPLVAGTSPGLLSFSQVVSIPTDGEYQVSYFGSANDSSSPCNGNCLRGIWSVGNTRIEWPASANQSAHQRSAVVSLSRGLRTIRLTSTTRRAPAINAWRLSQPVLRKVVAPATAVAIDYVRTGYHRIEFGANAEVLLLGLLRTSAPVRVPGFGYGLEINLNGPHLVLATASRPPVVFRTSSIHHATRFGNFYLQAIRLGSNPSFGSRIYVE